MSNVKVTKKGLVEKSTGRKVISPMDLIKDDGLKLKILKILMRNENIAQRQSIVRLFASVAEIIYFTPEDVLTKKCKLEILEDILKIKGCISLQEPLTQAQLKVDEN